MPIQVTALMACQIVFVSAVGAAQAQYYPIDLQSQANHRLDEDFAPGHYPGDKLSELNQGRQKLGGIPFQIGTRLIEVAGKFLPNRPERVDGIEVGRHVKNLYILQGARWGAYGKEGDSLGHWVADGTPIGFYEVHYAGAETVAIPIVYGVDVRDWWSIWDHSKPTRRGKVVWTGSNPHLRTRSEARRTKKPLRLYLAKWENPHPESLVTSINLVSLHQTATPFCVAITVKGEPGRYNTEIQKLEARLKRLQTDFQKLKLQIDGKGQPEKTSARGFFDDFEGSYRQEWSLLNENRQNVSLTKRPGMLTITTEQGGIWKQFHGTKNIFLIDNPVATGGDFIMSTRLVGFEPVANYNQAGLICFDDTDNYLKFVLQWDSHQGGKALSSLREVEGDNIRTHHIRVKQKLDEVWLQIIKKGNRYVVSASGDGQHYRVIGEEAWGNGRPAQVGLIAKNGAPRSAPQLEASFDFFDVEPLADEHNLLLLESEEVPPERSVWQLLTE